MARDFDGTDDRINFGDINALDGLANFSTAMWVNLDARTDEIAVNKQAVWRIAWDTPTGEPVFYISNSVVGVTATALGTWTHICGTYSDANNRITLYVDGVQDAQNTSFTDTMASNANAVEYGWSSAFGGIGFFNGRLAEVAFWNVELTAGEVLGLGKGFSPLFYQRGLVLYTPLIGRLSPEPDIIAGNNGTLSGPVVADHCRIFLRED